MDFRIVELTSASKVKVRAAQAAVIVPSQEIIHLSDDEIGSLEGRFSDHQRGIYMQGGIIDPGWTGFITIELLIYGECDIEVGQHLAHAIILRK